MVEKVNASFEMLDSKARSRKAWCEFFSTQLRLYLPNENPFTALFINQVNIGTKLLLPLQSATAPTLYQSRKDKSFDRKYLFDLVKSHEQGIKYIPDKSNHLNLKRSFLLAVSN